MNRMFVLVWILLALPVTAQEGDAPKPAERPAQDPKAVAMIEKLDSVLYVPRASGLKDLEFVAKLPSGFNLLIRWKDSDRVRADLVVPPDAPAAVKKQLELVKSKFEDEARKYAPSFAATQIGEVLRDKYKDDEITLVAPNQVKIVARSPASKASFKEHTLTFNDQGLTTQVKVLAPNGVENTIEPTYAEWKGKRIYQSIKTKFGKEETVVTFEHVEAGDFSFVKKMTTTATKGGAPQSLEFEAFKANAGIDDKVFEGK